MPLDPTYPPHRLDVMLQDAQVPVLLTQQTLVERLPQTPAKIVCLDRPGSPILDQSTENFDSGTSLDHLAYVIYTSGSTGTPKGVLITHRNVVRLFDVTQPLYQFNQGDRWTLFHSYAFDFSVWELWGALLYGGCLVIVPYGLSRSPQAFYQLLIDQEITVLNQTPSAFRQLIEVDATKPFPCPLKLRWVIFGGEALQVKSLAPWFERHGDTAPQLVNMYGITETTVHVTSQLLTVKTLEQRISPIGKALADLQIYILAPNMQPVPIGVAGELHIAGAGLAKGYLKRPHLTTARFIANPHGDGRLYKTGDLARYLSDGSIEYLGRIDHQVKLRGFRIELGEIETVLSGHPQVNQCVVQVQGQTSDCQQLVAYVVGESILPNDLRTFLKEQLPEYMVPNAFVVLESFPLTPNGKVDRHALPTPDTSRVSQGSRPIPPRNTIELQLAQLWSDVLNVETVGARDNFFDLGGHSLLAVRLMAKVAHTLGVQLPLTTLFSDPTLEAQAQLLTDQNDHDAVVHSPLVPIQPHGTLPPLFCIHPVGGNVFCYAELAHHLGRNQPLYGLQSSGLHRNVAPVDSIEAMATTYIDALKSVQPHGPYTLAGWSMGGAIAIEMAQQLQAIKEAVALVVLMDSYTPQVITKMNPTDASAFVTSEQPDTADLQSLILDLNGLFDRQLSLDPLQLATLDPDAQLAHILAVAQAMDLLPPEMTPMQMANLFDLFKANRMALARYQVQPYSGRVILCCAEADTDDRGWDAVLTGAVERVQVPGNHYGMMKSPHVQQLANVVRAAIRDAGPEE